MEETGRLKEIVYTFTCECGATVNAKGKEGRCHTCGLMFRVVWPDPDVKPGSAPKQLTISDKYDEASRMLGPVVKVKTDPGEKGGFGHD